MSSRQEESVPEIIKRWKAEKQLTTEQFLEIINRTFAPTLQISEPTFKAWISGARNPDYLTILYIFEHTRPSDWLNDFAQQMCFAIRPDIWKGEGQD